MNKEKGITLISVIVYLFAMVMALTIVGLITSFFFENIYGIKETGELISEYNKFNMFFVEDMKESYAVTVNQTDNRVIFIPEVGSERVIIYSLSDGGIYRDNAKIADNIASFNITFEGEDNEKTFRTTDVVKSGITVQVVLTDTTPFSMAYYLGRGY